MPPGWPLASQGERGKCSPLRPAPPSRSLVGICGRPRGRQRRPGEPERPGQSPLCPQVSATEDGTVVRDSSVVLEIPASTAIAYGVIELYVKRDGQFGECRLLPGRSPH